MKLYETELAHYRTDVQAAEKMATSESGKPPEGMDGRSLVPILRGRKEEYVARPDLARIHSFE